MRALATHFVPFLLNRGCLPARRPLAVGIRSHRSRAFASFAGPHPQNAANANESVTPRTPTVKPCGTRGNEHRNLGQLLRALRPLVVRYNGRAAHWRLSYDEADGRSRPRGQTDG